MRPFSKVRRPEAPSLGPVPRSLPTGVRGARTHRRVTPDAGRSVAADRAVEAGTMVSGLRPSTTRR